MKSSSKKKITKLLLESTIIGFALVSVLGILYFKKSLSPKETTPLVSRYATIDEIPDCVKNTTTVEIKKWKIYEDKYNNFSILIPQNYTLDKGPGQSLSDTEWQKITYQKNTFSFGFLASPNTKKISPVDSIGISLNADGCNSTEDCYEKVIKEISSYQSYISSCKLSKKVSGKQTIFVGTQFTNPNYTSWYAYMDTKYGVIRLSYLESGEGFMSFNDELLRAFDSLKFTK